MKSTNLVILCFWIFSLNCVSQELNSRIEIVQPTIEQEATSIWRTINDYSFLEKQGYKINLPKHALIDALIAKSKNGNFASEDFEKIYSLLETKFFDGENYKKAKQKVVDQTNLLNEFLDIIDAGKSQWDWQFKMFKQYKIVFTLYGTGGSYDPDGGVVTLLTNKEGGFLKYENPAYTIIHEISHMGMEYALVQEYNLSHGLKERLVDTFVLLMFKEKLPKYKIQNMGDSTIDNYLNKQKDIESLDRIMSDFVGK